MHTHPFSLALIVLCSCVMPLSAQTQQKQPKKGDAVIVRGCLRGSAVEQADLLMEDSEGDPKENDSVPPLTYRLQGEKKVLKELKDKHDRMIVQVKGILRSELSRNAMGTTVGRTRITIGADPRNPTRGTDQAMPVVEAMSFEGTTTSCSK
jgi:hypothetical protein